MLGGGENSIGNAGSQIAKLANCLGRSGAKLWIGIPGHIHIFSCISARAPAEYAERMKLRRVGMRASRRNLSLELYVAATRLPNLREMWLPVHRHLQAQAHIQG